MFGSLLKGHTGIVLVICRYWIIFLISLHMIQHLSLHVWLSFSYGLNTWVVTISPEPWIYCSFFSWHLNSQSRRLSFLSTSLFLYCKLHFFFAIFNCFNFLNIYKYLTKACSGRWISFVLVRVSHHLHFYT